MNQTSGIASITGAQGTSLWASPLKKHRIYPLVPGGMIDHLDLRYYAIEPNILANVNFCHAELELFALRFLGLV